jgi:hypothetical protein
VSERLHETDCPFALELWLGDTHDTEGLGPGRALDGLQRITSAERFRAYVSGVVPNSEKQRFWQVSAANEESLLSSLVFVGDGAILDGTQADALRSDRITLASFDYTFDREFFESQVTLWLNGLLPPVEVQRARELREAVEILLRELNVRVVENEELLALLDERDAFIDQLQGQIRTLEVELRRREFDPQRAVASVSMVRRLFTTARLTTAAAIVTAAATTGLVVEGAQQPKPQQPLIQIQGGIGDHARVIIEACNAVLQQGESPTDESPGVFGSQTFGSGTFG